MLLQKITIKVFSKTTICLMSIVLCSFTNISSVVPNGYPVSETIIKKIESAIPTEILKTNNTISKEKDVTIIFELAGVNNLGFFLRKNLSQLAETGSTKNVNILAQLHVLLSGNNKVTKRYYVEKDKLIILNHNDPKSQSLDSGDPASLINWCTYCVKNFPAKKYILVLSNHATGIIDIGQMRAVNPSELFIFNPATNMIELNRTRPFLEFIATPENQRGICFDDITGHYLTNQKLDYALKTICQNALRKKFEMIIFDACLQQMYEIALLLKPYTNLMLGSQEVILAPGLDYYDVLKPFENKRIETTFFAQHIVASYENSYKKITNDYTFSAVNLTNVAFLEKNVNTVAHLLTECLKNQKNGFVKEAIKTSRHRLLCTHFDEPSYIDLHHFYTNLHNNLQRFDFKAHKNDELTKTAVSHLLVSLKEGLQIINSMVIAQVSGKNLNQAKGLSIYFPEYGAKHPSYKYSHAWSIFLDHYLV
jgi:hypothetical protein